MFIYSILVDTNLNYLNFNDNFIPNINELKLLVLFIRI